MSSGENRRNMKKLTDAEIEEYRASPYASNSFKIVLEMEKVRRHYKGTEENPRGFGVNLEQFGFHRVTSRPDWKGKRKRQR